MKEKKKMLSDLWLESCDELWKVCKHRKIRNELTLWDVFRWMYMRYTPKSRFGRSTDVLE